jgi:hypothetical protein
MQCKPVTALPANETWTFEIKFDGYRCIVVKRGSAVTLFVATRKCLTSASPVIDVSHEHQSRMIGHDIERAGRLSVRENRSRDRVTEKL